MARRASSPDVESAPRAGMDDYVSKPVDLEALEAVLGHWIRDASDAKPLPEGSVSSDGEIATDGEEPSVEHARLAHLRELEAPDGSPLLTVVIGAFVAQGAERLAALRRAVEAEDHDQLRDLTHELKGASANIGARRLARLCGELETVATPAGSHSWRETG